MHRPGALESLGDDPLPLLLAPCREGTGDPRRLTPRGLHLACCTSLGLAVGPGHGRGVTAEAAGVKPALGTTGTKPGQRPSHIQPCLSEQRALRESSLKLEVSDFGGPGTKPQLCV